MSAEPNDPHACLPDLPAASSLMSSRWSRDNLVTSHPARLYDGRELEPIETESLEHLVQDSMRQIGPFRLGAGRMGVVTWDIECSNDAGPFVLQVPRALDEPGRRGRSKRDVPRLNLENMQYFRAQGLTRFVVEPRASILLGGNVPSAIFGALPEHRPLGFGRGSIQVEVSEGKLCWGVALGPLVTADLLAEMVAALVYHYEPAVDGGTAITDVFVNDGDFAVKRRGDGSFDVRLTAARRREPGIGPNLLLLYCVQMMTYEDFGVDGNLVGLPTLIGNPSVTFEGVVRGLRYRYRDLGSAEQAGVGEARRWIREFGRSREGRAYRPWVERFLEGCLPLEFGRDVRERWWRLNPLQRRYGLLELRGRRDPASTDAAAARNLRAFLERLTREIGRLPEEDTAVVKINDLPRDGVLSLLEEARIPPESRVELADRLLALWPHRSLDHLLAQVPGARSLRRLKSRISFGQVSSEADQGELRSFGAAPKEAGPRRPLANAEVFGALTLPPALHVAAAGTFPTFEAYMDAALHAETWGYYAHSVSIGKTGHFETNPEALSPEYGKWLAQWAFDAWREMLAHGELSETDAFPVVEFGAGNGRLARDFLDSLDRGAARSRAAEPRGFRTFAERVSYRIYEMSESLRAKQRELVRGRAIVAEGDARRPRATLERDFPTGVRGMVVTNEVPDAFGAHKVVLTAQGRALVALVVPRLERELCETLDDRLRRRVVETDTAVRDSFAFRGNQGDLYLDREAYFELMEAFAALPLERRAALFSALWFEEAFVSPSNVPELSSHLSANAAQYATALAAEDSGVVVYVNVHASRFIRELGACLRAGIIITIDYGDTTWGLVQGARRGDFPFRVYGDWQDYVPRPNDPYSEPGTQDLTTDVNFTDLAQAAEGSGLRVLHFGLERDVAGAELPGLVQASVEREPLAKFLGNPVFKILVLGTRPSELFNGPLLSPVALFCREQDLPKSRRQAIPLIQKELEQSSLTRG